MYTRSIQKIHQQQSIKNTRNENYDSQEFIIVASIVESGNQLA